MHALRPQADLNTERSRSKIKAKSSDREAEEINTPPAVISKHTLHAAYMR
jgi:hypothetical protein